MNELGWQGHWCRGQGLSSTCTTNSPIALLWHLPLCARGSWSPCRGRQGDIPAWLWFRSTCALWPREEEVPLDLWGLWLLLLQRTTPELLFVFGSPGDSLACHIFLGPGGKASLCNTHKKVMRLINMIRDRIGTWAILGVLMGSGKHQRPGRGRPDNREGKPECSTQNTS